MIGVRKAGNDGEVRCSVARGRNSSLERHLTDAVSGGSGGERRRSRGGKRCVRLGHPEGGGMARGGDAPSGTHGVPHGFSRRGNTETLSSPNPDKMIFHNNRDTRLRVDRSNDSITTKSNKLSYSTY